MSKLSVTIDGRTFEVEINIPPHCDGSELPVTVDGQPLQVAVSCVDGPEQLEWIMIEGRSHEIVVDRDLRWLHSHGRRHRLEVRDLEASVTRPVSGDGRVKAPIPGMITRVLVAAGDRVEAGQPIIVLEAMKMENEITAPAGGTVEELGVSEGAAISTGDTIAVIK